MVTPAAIKVLLPNSSTAEKMTTKRNINLVVTSNLEYFINDKKVAFDDLKDQLEKTIGSREDGDDINVLLQADKSLNLQDLINVIDIGNQLHIKMVLFTQKD